MKTIITIRKAFQELAFEPFEVAITIESEVKDQGEINKLYDMVLESVNKKIDERVESMK